MQAYAAAGTHRYAFAAALLVAARNEKLFEHPATDEWRLKGLYHGILLGGKKTSNTVQAMPTCTTPKKLR